MVVIKKDGLKEDWNNQKIIDAIKKASLRCESPITKEQAEEVANKVFLLVQKLGNVHTLDLHSMVIDQLKLSGFDKIANAYQEYRDYKNTYAKNWEELKQQTDNILYLGDRENANFDSSLISTKGSLIKGSLTKELYKQFYLSNTEKALIKRGDIYIHDLRDMIYGSVNCCLFDFKTVLSGGFDMCNVHYTEPTSVASALQVIGDITLVASSQQFGGFTIPEIDKTLLPYIKKSLKKYKKEAEDYNIEFKDSYIDKHVKRELEQGFQGLELKLNTVVSARGDFPFTTLTFGQWNTNLEPVDKYWLSEVCLAILNTRIKGHAGKQVVFPKLVYLYDENQVNNDDYSKKVFNKALECSAKCMYPDWLSLSGSEKVNKVAQEFKNYGKIISPMGCRAYLSHWIDPETNEAITVGRCNIGAVSLNIPLIIAVAQKEFSSNWKDKFWDLLEDRLEVVRNFLRKRYDMIKHTKASTNPMAFTQGGFYEGYLKPDEEIGDLVKYMTASFGITALNEASILWFNKSIAEDNSFAISVMEFITDKVESFKRQDGYLYALYGTPAESLMGTQAKQYKDYTGDTRFGEYFSNSFHCHVSEDITPIEKQDKEFRLFHMINGGHIQYVRLDNPENIEAVKSVILRGMKLGFYQGVNFDAGYCEDCGSHFTNCMNTCPNCGSTHITIISRVCGYLGYSKVDGNTRFNDALLQNVHDRKSM